MTARDFCYWLQGYFDGGPYLSLKADQAETIRKHLAMVFAHDIDPKSGDAAEQDKLNQLHGNAGTSPRC